MCVFEQVLSPLDVVPEDWKWVLVLDEAIELI